MNFEVNIVQLGMILNELSQHYKMKILAKAELSGGWVTIGGDAYIEKYPEASENRISKDNIIHIRIKENNETGSILKLTGAKNRKFSIEAAPSRYREINIRSGINLNQIKINNDECKIKIDDKIVITIDTNTDNIHNVIKKYS